MFNDSWYSAVSITFCEEALWSMTASITTPVLNILPEFQPPHAHILNDTTNKETRKCNWTWFRDPKSKLQVSNVKCFIFRCERRDQENVQKLAPGWLGGGPWQELTQLVDICRLPGKRMASYLQFAKLERSLIGNCCTVGLTSKAHLEKDMNGVRNERGGC